MISIAEAISDLLFVRDTVVVPGLGAFVKKPIPAKVNPVANYFSKPSSAIEFDSNLREDNELIVRYLSEKNEIPEDEARKVLAMFVSDCFNTLKSKKKVTLAGIGDLYYDWAGDLAFEPDKTVNYNSDAFGLGDFTMQPIDRFKTKDEIKDEIQQQQKEKNTPMSVDEKAVHEYDDDNPRRLVWLWILLGLLLVAAGVIYGLHEFKIITFPWEKEEPRLILSEPRTYTLPVYTKEWKWIEPVAQDSIQVQDMIQKGGEDVVGEKPVESKVEPKTKPITEPKTEPSIEPADKPITDASIRIIAGCFAQEDNAARLANSLKEKGFPNAFYEKRKTKWFVSFGRYATEEEATAALREIRKNTEYKAWILK